MLPRAEMYKEILFIPRIICFNQSFVPVGKSKKHNQKPLAVIWNESIAGRKKEDIISAFYAFFLRNKEMENITIWLDNCSGQNKNWAIFTFFVYIVNASEVALKQLELKFFLPGHTFMSADAFHHHVELSLKKMKKVWDFDHFKEAVESACPKVCVADMKIDNFFNWKDLSSKYKLKRTEPRPYLQNMVLVVFKRGENILRYKTNFNEENYIELNFLVAKTFKEGIKKPIPREVCRGVAQDRKRALIERIQPIIPKHRVQFWLELPVAITTNESSSDDSD